ncbi:MAG: 4Fe-4S dicluster domain-containing protein, partial [Planctomycetota bacterium JB042]
MVDLRPAPFPVLVTRMFRELEERDSIFDLPRARWWTGADGLDLSVPFHDRRASTPFRPAAGPQSQLAQNLVLSWLGGARILELKTVQVDDALTIPRPCIDMQTVGYNVEWSQELKVDESLEEYVKGSMLIELLRASGAVTVADGDASTIFDMSVGYDLAGIRGEKVQRFVEGMKDAADVVDRLRREIPAPWATLRDVEFTTRLSETLTLSTFHGCPPDEIEAIIRFLYERNGLHCIVKFNPTLLGRDAVRRLVHTTLGHDEIEIPDDAFEKDTTWPQAVEICERLGARADELGLGFGAKFSNTLLVRNHRDFFPPTERAMYLSGPPLHVLALQLVARFREAFGDRWPISFAAGVDRRNFPDAVALGLRPVTVCSDLLKPGGYARASGYLDELAARMRAVGAATIDGFVRRAYADDPDAADGRPLDRARLENTAALVPRATADPRYARAATAKPPRKIGSHLELFDCITCDKCVPVCPNDANFTFVVPPFEAPVVLVRRDGDRLAARVAGTLAVEKKHQIGNFADFCNECGNCDVFCPEDGGPYLVKPRFFGNRDDFAAHAELDGVVGSPSPDGVVLDARIGGRTMRLAPDGDRVRLSGEGYD